MVEEERPRVSAAEPAALIESLPDALLQQCFLSVGLRDAYDVCRLPLVCRRFRAVLRAVDWSELCFSMEDVQEDEDGDRLADLIGAWSGRAAAGRLSVASLVVNSPKLSGAAASRTIPALVSKLQGLRRLCLSHGDPANTRQDSMITLRLAYMLEIASASPASLEELAIESSFQLYTTLLSGEDLDPLLAALRRLPALTKLDLAGYCVAEAAFVRAVAAAAPALSALGVRVAGAQTSELAEAVAQAYPSLKELRIVRWANELGRRAMRAIGGGLRSLRHLEIGIESDFCQGDLQALAEALGGASSVESLALRGKWYFRRLELGALAAVASLRSLSLETFDQRSDWSQVAHLTQLRSLSLVAVCRELEQPLIGAREGWAERMGATLARLTFLSDLRLELRIRLARVGEGSYLAELPAALSCLPPAARLSLAVVDADRTCMDRGFALAGAVAGVLRAAGGSLERYSRVCQRPFAGEAAALAACRRLRAVRLEVLGREPALPELLEGLAPLAAIDAPSLKLDVKGICLTSKPRSSELSSAVARVRELLPGWAVRCH